MVRTNEGVGDVGTRGARGGDGGGCWVAVRRGRGGGRRRRKCGGGGGWVGVGVAGYATGKNTHPDKRCTTSAPLIQKSVCPLFNPTPADHRGRGIQQTVGQADAVGCHPVEHRVASHE